MASRFSGQRREHLVENNGLEMAEIAVDGDDTEAVPQENIPSRSPRKKHYLGASLALIASVFLTTAALFIKLAKSVPSFEGVFVRFQLQIIYSFPLMICNRDQFFYPMRTTKFLILRGIAGGSAMCCLFYSLKNMPFGDATALRFTFPIFTAILGFVFLKETLSKFDIFAGILSLGGIILIARPSFLFGGKTPDTSQVIAICVALLGAVLTSLSMLLTRKLVSTTVRPRVVVLYMAVVGSVVAVAAALATGEKFTFPDCGTTENWFILLMGLTAYSGQMLQAKALSLEKAAICSVIRTSSIVLTYILQILFLDDVLDAFSIGGAVLVVLCNITIFVSHFVRAKKTLQ